jgi:hypothetical protein
MMFNRNLAIDTLLNDAEDGVDYESMSDEELIEELEARDISYLFAEDDA